MASWFDPEGEMYTPKVRNPAVGSILGIEITESNAPSDVISMLPGVAAIFCRRALPPTQFQDRRNQKHFERFKAPPVL
jgi:hypothetical protein